MFEGKALDRRAFLRSGMVGAGAVALAGVAAACGGPSGGSGPTSAKQASKILPKYIPYSMQLPTDFPGNSDGLVPYFPHYPQNPKPVTNGTPGDGSAVSAMTITYSPIVPGL